MFFRKIVDKIIDFEVERRKKEVEQRLEIEKDKLWMELATKRQEVYVLTTELETQIKGIEKTRQKAEEEQKGLWERLDILKDNLNANGVMNRLWECAYSKAIDAVWSILKKETIHLTELANEDGQNKAKEEANKQYEKKLDDIIKKDMSLINIPLLYKLKEESRQQYLIFQRSKDNEKVQYFKGQIDLIAEILNEKK